MCDLDCFPRAIVVWLGDLEKGKDSLRAVCGEERRYVPRQELNVPSQLRFVTLRK